MTPEGLYKKIEGWCPAWENTTLGMLSACGWPSGWYSAAWWVWKSTEGIGLPGGCLLGLRIKGLALVACWGLGPIWAQLVSRFHYYYIITALLALVPAHHACHWTLICRQVTLPLCHHWQELAPLQCAHHRVDDKDHFPPNSEKFHIFSISFVCHVKYTTSILKITGPACRCTSAWWTTSKLHSHDYIIMPHLHLCQSTKPKTITWLI